MARLIIRSAGAPAASPPESTVAPAISGTVAVDGVLTTTNGTWSNSPSSYSYQWKRATTSGGTYSDISGATSSTYTLLVGDETYYVKCTVTASNAAGSNSADSDIEGPVAAAGPGTLPRITSTSGSITYVGQFTIPTTLDSGGSTSTEFTTEQTGPFAVGPSSTLYWRGHRQGTYMGRITIPSIGGTATVATDAFDVATDIGLGAGTPGKILSTAGGGIYYGGRVVVSLVVNYDANNDTNKPHITVDTAMTTKAGGYAMKWSGDTQYNSNQTGAANAYFYSGSMGHIPTVWQSALGGPVMCATGFSSNNQRCPWGHSMYAFDPDDFGTGTLGDITDPVPAYPLCIHPLWAPADTNMQVDGVSCSRFQTTDQVQGVAFPSGTRSVLVIGFHGNGSYGYGIGTGDAELAGTPMPPPSVFYYQYDPCISDEGNHAWPYQNRIWAYDANDLAAVKAGTMNPQDVLPYEYWSLDNIPPDPVLNAGGSTYSMGSCPRIYGAAYDDSTGFLYVVDHTNQCQVFKITAPEA